MNKLLVVLFLVSAAFCFFVKEGVSDTETCNYVGDNCPVWNGWSPKCHVSGPVCDSNRYCYIDACTYSAAKMFGTSTDLLAAVNGIIDRNHIQVHDQYNCANYEFLNDSTFKVHCACGGSCSFHGNYRIYYYSY